MAFVNEKSEIPGESRTVDYERDAVLKGGAESIKYYRQPSSMTFTLTWKGEKIELGALYKNEIFDDGSGKFTWFIQKCIYPEQLRPYKAEIIQLVVDAIQAYGVNYGKMDRTEVTVQISPSLGNLQMEPLHELPPSPSDESRRLL